MEVNPLYFNIILADPLKKLRLFKNSQIVAPTENHEEA